MAIILDADSGESKTYTGYLEHRLFLALAEQLPDKTFLHPAGSLKSLYAIPNLQAIDYLPVKGIFKQQKTEKWLKEHDVTAFISFRKTLATRQPVRQVLLISSEKWFNKSALLNATDIGFTLDYLRKIFVKKYLADAKKHFTLQGILSKIASSTTADMIKNSFTDGRDFFICTDFELRKETLIILLKAFSAFKRMLQSSWKLMVVLRSADAVNPAEAGRILANYKYREDVVITDDRALADKIAASYALITLNRENVYPVAVAEAIELNIPVIAVPNNAVKDIYNDALIYAPAETHEAVGEMLMMIYKAEAYRNELIKKMNSRPRLPGMGTLVQELKTHLTGIL
ncbi:MAG: hypothetical protein QM640_13655 [Niabella sp.]